ncbi:MAG: hypothetical protein WA840_05435 [Caulobacteraceae bacterium]
MAEPDPWESLRPANDNGSSPDERKIDAVVLRLARLIGRQLAREQFGRSHSPANDNNPGEP